MTKLALLKPAHMKKETLVKCMLAVGREIHPEHKAQV